VIIAVIPKNNSNRMVTYKIIPTDAIATAIAAFLTSSCPTIGETTLTLGSFPYLSPKNCLTSFTFSLDNTVSKRLTAITFLSPEMTIDLASKPNSSKPSLISSELSALSANTSTRVPLVKSIPGLSWKRASEIPPSTTIKVEAIKNFLRCWTTLTLRFINVASFSSFAAMSLIESFLTPNHVGRFFKNGLLIQSCINNLVPNTAVMKLTKILTINMVANPLIELVP